MDSLFSCRRRKDERIYEQAAPHAVYRRARSRHRMGCAHKKRWRRKNLGISQRRAAGCPIHARIQFSYELIVAIANEGRTDTVMNAARAAGAMGGTVLHGKGTTSPESEKFLGVSIAKEKEVILIVARKEQKADIMRSIMTRAARTRMRVQSCFPSL